MLRRKRRRLAVTEDAECDASTDLIDDTMSSIQLLLNRNAYGFSELGLPPLILWHQLYTVLPNRTFVDQNVHRLRTEGKVVTFKVPSGVDDMAVLRSEDYSAEVEKYQRILREQLKLRPEDKTIACKLRALTAFRRALPELNSLSTVSLKVLARAMSTGGSSVEEKGVRDVVVQIQRLGFVLPTTRLDDEAYSLSAPGIGKLMSALKKTRTFILSTLKRTKYKEMHEQQLQKAKLKHSKFQLEFHLADMEGCGLIRRTKVTSGVLVALTDK